MATNPFEAPHPIILIWVEDYTENREEFENNKNN